MLFSIAFSFMLISSISVILYVNYFTALHKKKEMKKMAAAKRKLREPLQIAEPESEGKQVLVEAVL